MIRTSSLAPRRLASARAALGTRHIPILGHASSLSQLHCVLSAGPVGRTATAQTVAQMHADILSWSRSQGLFVGLAPEGASLRQDLDDNDTLYGKKFENRDIVENRVRPPKEAVKLIALLNRYSDRERQSQSK